MIQKKEFNESHKQLILSYQKLKCNKCEKKFNVSNLPEFGYIDGNIANNSKGNLQALCMDCFTFGENQK